MFRDISLTQQIPNKLKTMRIKSIHKKGSKLLMDNKIGIFLTNILSKVYENVLDLMTTEKVRFMSINVENKKRLWNNRQHDHDDISNRQQWKNKQKKKHISTFQMHRDVLTNCG